MKHGRVDLQEIEVLKTSRRYGCTTLDSSAKLQRKLPGSTASCSSTNITPASRRLCCDAQDCSYKSCCRNNNVGVVAATGVL